MTSDRNGFRLSKTQGLSRAAALDFRSGYGDMRVRAGRKPCGFVFPGFAA